MEKLKDICKRMEDIVSAEIAKGIENVDAKELGEAVDVIKDLKEAMYYGSVVKAMEESEEEEKFAQKMGMSEDMRMYRGQPRNAKGQYKADGRPNRNYNPIMMPEIYSMDMYDKMPNRMYEPNMEEEYKRGYRDGMSSNMSGRTYDGNNVSRAMRNYEDYRRNHTEMTPTENANKSKEAENMMREIDTKLKEYKNGQMSAEEKQTIKTWLDKMLKEW